MTRPKLTGLARETRNAYQRAYHVRRKVEDPTFGPAKNAATKRALKAREALDPEYRIANLRAKREAEFFRRYGMSLEERTLLFEQQEGLCAICSTLLCLCTAENCPTKAHVDHDHSKVGRESVRGLLCNPCNSGVGLMRDNSRLCRNAASYLEVA